MSAKEYTQEAIEKIDHILSLSPDYTTATTNLPHGFRTVLRALPSAKAVLEDVSGKIDDNPTNHEGKATVVWICKKTTLLYNEFSGILSGGIRSEDNSITQWAKELMEATISIAKEYETKTIDELQRQLQEVSKIPASSDRRESWIQSNNWGHGYQSNNTGGIEQHVNTEHGYQNANVGHGTQYNHMGHGQQNINRGHGTQFNVNLKIFDENQEIEHGSEA
ncbi:hypothetical protein M426DRAFT_21860 [Hypoxylon sp. CI-4A]|nr:hypothetical protein M426DRAFT_21860 [Hypoxylon sp. CI-4A]